MPFAFQFDLFDNFYTKPTIACKLTFLQLHKLDIISTVWNLSLFLFIQNVQTAISFHKNAMIQDRNRMSSLKVKYLIVIPTKSLSFFFGNFSDHVGVPAKRNDVPVQPFTPEMKLSNRVHAETTNHSQMKKIGANRYHYNFSSMCVSKTWLFVSWKILGVSQKCGFWAMFDKPELPDFYGVISHFSNLIELPKDFYRKSLAD